MSRETIAYLRGYADAVSTLAEMAMVTRGHRHRYVVWYDDDASEYVVTRQWYEGWRDGGTLLESEMARAGLFPDAVQLAYEMFQENRS